MKIFSVETDEDIDQLFDMVNDRVESVLGKTLEYIGIVTVEEFRDFLIDNANLLDREVADILGLGEEWTETENETEVLVDPLEYEVDDFETLYRKRQQMRQRGSEEFHESLSTKKRKSIERK